MAIFDPLLTHAGKSLVEVDLYCRIGVGSRRVVDHDIFVGIFHTLPIFNLDGGVLVDLSHRYAHSGECAVDIYFLGVGI